MRGGVRAALAILAIAAAAPRARAQVPCVGTMSVVSADSASFLVRAPRGWVLDCNAGKDQGPLTVLYRQGETWRTGEAVMYVSVLTDRGVPPMPHATRIAAEVEDWRRKAPDARVTTLASLTAKGSVAKVPVRRFESAAHGLIEVVAYVPRGRIMPLLTMTARSERAFRSVWPAFRALVESYEPATLKITPTPAPSTPTPPARVADTTALYATIAARDSALFDAFNRCDAVAMTGFFTEDLEFYHDWNGLMGPRQPFIDGFAEACRRHEVGRRELVPGTMEVHAMRNVGALQIGVHRFFIRKPDGSETPGSTAKFVMLWRNTASGWRISRVLSFDHRL